MLLPGADTVHRSRLSFIPLECGFPDANYCATGFVAITQQSQTNKPTHLSFMFFVFLSSV